MSNDSRLTPFVYWSQDESKLRLRVALTNVKDPEVLIGERRIVFEAIGEGAGGKHVYGFDLNLHSDIVDKNSFYNIHDRGVDFVLEKRSEGKGDPEEQWWPKLTSAARTPWLKIDFDKWRDPPGYENEMDEDPSMMQQFDMGKYAGLSEAEAAKKMADEILGDMGKKNEVLNLRLIYMFTYNLLLGIGFVGIFGEMMFNYSLHGPDYFERTYGDISPKWHCCQLAQWLEVLHSLLGYTSGSWKTAVVQNTARSFSLFLLASEPVLQMKPFVFYLFCVWATIELVRYPYYASAVLGKSFRALTWLRYTMWIPLYPLGLLIEGVIVLRAIPLFQQSQKYSYGYFKFDIFLHFVILGCMLPGVGFLMYTMHKQRQKKLSDSSARHRRKPKRA